MHKAVFLDKDGTLVDSSEFPQVIPTDKVYDNHTTEGLKKLQEAGYLLIIISNQGWISRNQLTQTRVQQIFNNVVSHYEKKKVKITDFYYCPHASSDGCDCRKPKTEMFKRAAAKYDVDMSQSYMIGDRSSDIVSGKRAGARTILVQTEGNTKYESLIRPDYITKDVNSAANIILGNN
jgi:D-glycero-D-manno-heptose 1,7-bisphosphate phosphatase